MTRACAPGRRAPSEEREGIEIARCAVARLMRAMGLHGAVRHGDRGVQYVSITYTERLASAGIALSVGSAGDSFDNALAETIISLFKTAVIRRLGPWRCLEAVAFATLALALRLQPKAAASLSDSFATAR